MNNSMIKGHLRFLVLNELNSNPKTGYELMKDVGEYCGKKPSAGSIYPLLESLLGEKHISVKQEGNKKIYSILVSGRRKLEKIKSEKEKMIRKHMEMLRNAGQEECIPLDDLDKKKDAVLRNMGIFMEFKQALLKAGKKGVDKHEKEIREILRDAIIKLKRIK